MNNNKIILKTLKPKKGKEKEKSVKIHAYKHAHNYMQHIVAYNDTSFESVFVRFIFF